jgi:hypothetical protein
MKLPPVLSDTQFHEYRAKICQHFPGLPIDKSAVERRMKLRNSYKESLRKANHRMRVIQIKLDEANAYEYLDEQLFEFYLKMEERDAITQVHTPIPKRPKRRGQYTGQSERTKKRRKKKERDEMKDFVEASDGSSDEDEYEQYKRYKRRRREGRRLKKVQRILDDAPGVPHYDAMDTRSVTPSPTTLIRQVMDNLGV